MITFLFFVCLLGLSHGITYLVGWNSRWKETEFWKTEWIKLEHYYCRLLDRKPKTTKWVLAQAKLKAEKSRGSHSRVA